MQRDSTCARLALGAGVLSAALLLSADTVVGGGGGGGVPAFQGAGPGAPVAFTPLALPPVAEGPFNAPAGSGIGGSFSPSMQDLASGQTVITTEDQMKYAWRRLFGQGYPQGAFDFDNEFVVIMGGGLLDPSFGFEITSVELSDAGFADFRNTTYPVQFLAVTASTILPGVPPKKMEDPVWMVSAVAIDTSLLRDNVVFGRVDLALP